MTSLPSDPRQGGDPQPFCAGSRSPNAYVRLTSSLQYSRNIFTQLSQLSQALKPLLSPRYLQFQLILSCYSAVWYDALRLELLGVPRMIRGWESLIGLAPTCACDFASLTLALCD